MIAPQTNNQQANIELFKKEVNKKERTRAAVGRSAAYYRENPHRFAIDCLGMTWLAPFQMILLNVFVRFPYVMIIASRGMGKSLIVAAALCVMCILWPGKEVVIAAGVRSQSANVLKKIQDEFIPASANLDSEIKTIKISPNEAFATFRNGSKITVVAASDNSRSARAHLVLVDEFVQVKKVIIDTVLRKFRAAERRPGFFDLPKYSDNLPEKQRPDDWVFVPKERNAEIYISSAYYKYHYSWEKFKAYFKSMVVKDGVYFVAGFPYQLPVSAGYYPLTQIQDEMQESDFNPVSFSMEMDSLFWGESESAFFSFKDVNVQRKIPQPIYPAPFYDMLGDRKLKPPPKKNGEIRLLAGDVATQGGMKNDATAICLLCIVPNDRGQYFRYVPYIETIDGGHGQVQATRIRQLYDDLEADYVVLDTNGVGITVYDSLVQDITDSSRNVIYDAWSCINDDTMAARSGNPDGEKVIYSIKASLRFNSDIAVLLRDNMRRGKIRFLVNQEEGGEWLGSLSSYQRLSAEQQTIFEAPFAQTTCFVNELIELDYEMVNGSVRVKEKPGKRKDRYSCVAYANYIASEIERSLTRNSMDDLLDFDASACISVVEF